MGQPALFPRFDPRRHALWQIVALAVGVALLTALIVWLFFQAGLDQQTRRLEEIAQSRAALIQAMALHARDPHAEVDLLQVSESTLAQVRSAHENFPGIGESGEFTLARQEDGKIVFLLSHRHVDLDTPQPVPMESPLAEPMRRALAGKTGTVIGLDYRGATVIAAHRPIPDLGWGIVAKIDLAEVRAPYIRAGVIAVILALLTVSASAVFSLRAIRPFVTTLERSENRYRLLVENQNDLVISFDPELRLTFVSNNYCDTFGQSRETLLSGSFVPMVHEEDRPRVRQSLQSLFSPPYQTSHEERALTTAGWRWFQWSDRALLDERGRVLEIVAVGRDITAHKQAEESRVTHIRQLRQHEVVINNAAEAVLTADADGNILSVNPAFTRITGYGADEVVGRNPRLLKSAKHDEEFYREMYATLERDGVWQGEIWNRRKDGGVFPAWETITRVDDEEGGEEGDGHTGKVRYISMFADISERKLREERIRWLAHHDGLTGLPNRLLFEERCEHALARARRNGAKLALLFIDLDRFKPVNDELGHAVGDQLLQEVAHRLQRSIREEDTVARIGGDEFTILLEELAQPNDAEKVAQKVLAELTRPFLIHDHRVEIGGSIGIAVHPEHGGDCAELLKKADVAMYRSKDEGRGCFTLHTP